MARLLLYVAAVEATNMQSMVGVLGMGRVSALYAVNHWEREAVMVTCRRRRQRIVGSILNSMPHQTCENG